MVGLSFGFAPAQKALLDALTVPAPPGAGPGPALESDHSTR
jgi:hypothetical protein